MHKSDDDSDGRREDEVASATEAGSVFKMLPLLQWPDGSLVVRVSVDFISSRCQSDDCVSF